MEQLATRAGIFLISVRMVRATCPHTCHILLIHFPRGSHHSFPRTLEKSVILYFIFLDSIERMAGTLKKFCSSETNPEYFFTYELAENVFIGHESCLKTFKELVCIRGVGFLHTWKLTVQ